MSPNSRSPANVQATPSPCTVKRLRELCVNIHEENLAFLLRTTLPEFPISVVNEFFNGSKLNKPASREDREWTDIVRLTLIAFSPDGSAPAQLRGKPFPRYKRAYPFDPRPDRADADEPGALTLYPARRTTPILADIAAALGVESLTITHENWLACYIANPFPLKNLRINVNPSDSNSTVGRDSMDIISQNTTSFLDSELPRLADALPDSLEKPFPKWATNPTPTFNCLANRAPYQGSSAIIIRMVRRISRIETVAAFQRIIPSTSSYPCARRSRVLAIFRQGTS